MRHPSGIKVYCFMEGCERPVYGHGRCKLHYQQWYRSPEYRRLPYHGPHFLSVEERLWAKVIKTETCWLWQGGVDGRGYGHLSLAHGKLIKAHRLSYELAKGPIPDGLQIDHLCFVRNCVNPDHLEAVTGDENTRRAAVRHDTCKNGHLYNEATTHWYRGFRTCRVCHRLNEQKRRERRRANAA